MKKIELKIKSTLHKGLFWCITLMSVISIGCNEDYPNLSNKYPEPNTTFAGKNSKVLLITVDGLSGIALSSFSSADLPTFTEMKKNALFASRSLSDFETNSLTYPTSYATLFTGVTSDKHGVLNPSSTISSGYPTFIKRIKAYNQDKSATVFSTNQDAFEQLSEDIDHVEYLNTDDEAVSKAVAHIGTEASDIVVVNLSNTEKVGNPVSYSIANQDYRGAIKDFDANLKKIKSALERRPTYNVENWLVIITSTQGASIQNLSANISYEDLNRDTFTLFFNKNFSSVPIAAPNLEVVPYSGNAPVYNGDLNVNRHAMIPNDGGAYNFGTDDFTIRFSMKGSGVQALFPAFLSKAGRMDDNEPGWRLYISRTLLSIQVGGNGNKANWGTNLIVNDGKWHNVTVVFFKENGTRKVKAFVDGVKSTAIQDIQARGSVSTNEPVRIGRNKVDPDLPDLQLTHLQFYNYAWSDSDVMNTFCKIEVDQNSLHFDRLVGYWPADDQANILKNKAPNAGDNKDFILTSTTTRRSFNDISELLCPRVQSTFYQLVPNAVDVASTVYVWMGIPIQSTWNLDGKVWPFVFNHIKP